MFEESWFRLLAQHIGPQWRANNAPAFPKGSEQHLRIVLLMARESWKLQPSPAGCALGSVHSPLDMGSLWRVDILPSLGQGQGAGRVGEGAVSSFANQQKSAGESGTSDSG